MKTIFSLVAVFTYINFYGQILSYSDYRDPSDVEDALNSLTAAYPSLTDVRSIGNSVNGLPIQVLKISDNAAVDEPGEADIVFIALMHAREWITTETLIYIADRMLAEYSTNSELKADIDASQIWIIPVANPDGHAFTHSVPLPSDGLTNLDYSHPRWWRKNRRNNGDGTFGVDLNRNWGHQWGLSSGSSSITSSDIYRGSMPFSEPENLSLKNFLDGLNNLKTFVSYHGFSELYLKPWAYSTADAPGESTLRSIALRNIDRIQAVHGRSYAETIGYLASGETTDYVWEQHRTAAFTPEIRPPGPISLAGFHPPTSQILPSGQEQYAAAIALLHDAARTGVFVRDHTSDSGSEPSAIWTGSNWSAPFWTSPDISTVPEVLNQNADVQLKIRVNNNTGGPMNNVTVEAYYTDPRISLEFPNPNAVLIDSGTYNIPPGGREITFNWRTPTGPNSWGELHWCVGVVVKHEDDMPLTTLVQKSSNVSCRNFHTTDIVEFGTLMLAAYNFLDVPAELLLNVDPNSISSDWIIELPERVADRTGQLTEGTQRKARLLNTSGFILEPGETIYLPASIKTNENVAPGQTLDINFEGVLLPLVAGERKPVGNGFSYKVRKK